uniref:Insulin-like domain-containing protein n=1 Tax=Electrophorus electricus TaxID=8005 RepID=A0A4W4FW70_ELEEL
MPRLLSVILTWVSIVSVCASAESASRTALQRDYGVKLCGREFIRAVIFTCGGSRWKRSLDLDLVHSGETVRDEPAPPYSPDRRKRNFSLGLAGMCCTQGCTKNDIGRLC